MTPLRTTWSVRSCSRRVAAVVFACGVSACSPPPAPTATSTPTPADAASPASSGRRATLAVQCFEHRTKDGSVLSFQYTDYMSEAVGILDYSFKEKDSAHGTFRGRRDGDLITALWTHAVEGTTQTQEVVIRLEANRAVKANGELVEGADGVLRLRDRSAAGFNEAFERVQCD